MFDWQFRRYRPSNNRFRGPTALISVQTYSAHDNVANRHLNMPQLTNTGMINPPLKELGITKGCHKRRGRYHFGTEPACRTTRMDRQGVASSKLTLHVHPTLTKSCPRKIDVGMRPCSTDCCALIAPTLPCSTSCGTIVNLIRGVHCACTK